ncbi:succinylglutamate desuccinylase/aspartoacylase family protein [Congregibacter sp.]|uniref:succinylglutamate desuccinylase/aspartoacylase domain-containing protein n=1 Tax=Congregibacter sp. TaxID=2744308 RepID=UPI00385C312A
MKKISAVFSLFTILSVATWAGAEEFSVGDIHASRGTLVSGFLEIPSGIDEGSKIPVTIAHGSSEGPVLALLAGVHGYEYPPITALQAIRSEIDPGELRGTVIMVHVANMPSFLGRTIYYSPVDGENLNRMFPGDPQGSLSQRIAHTITTEVIDQADYLIDLHSGDGNEALRPYVYMPVTGNEPFDTQIRGMAVAFGLDHIVIDTGPQTATGPSLFTDQTALVRGIPAITTETGQSGSNDPYWSGLAQQGVWNVLRHLSMIPGDEIPNPGITWLSDYQVVKSPESGIFKPLTKDGYTVTEGAILGILLDFFGNEVTKIRAPFSGMVNYVISTPPVSKGEPVAMLSKIQGS